MNNRNSIRNLLWTCLAVFWTGVAIAQTAPFIIQVPVDLRDIHPDVQSGRVSCQVLDDQATPIAGGIVEFGIDRRTRSFSRTLQVNAQLADGKSPLDARRYQCALDLKDVQSDRTVQPGTPRAEGDTKFEPVPGAPFTPVVSGVIPSSLPQVSVPIKSFDRGIQPK